MVRRVVRPVTGLAFQRHQVYDGSSGNNKTQIPVGLPNRTRNSLPIFSMLLLPITAAPTLLLSSASVIANAARLGAAKL